MRYLLFFPFFLFCSPFAMAAPIAQPACLPPRAVQGEPDGWLLLAGLVVCMAGRLAARR